MHASRERRLRKSAHVPTESKDLKDILVYHILSRKRFLQGGLPVSYQARATNAVPLLARLRTQILFLL